MPKFLQVISILLVFSLLLCGCEQFMSRNLGGESQVILTTNQKLVMVTWKGDDIWMLFRPARKDEKAETYTFQEKSLLGVLQGKVIIKENF